MKSQIADNHRVLIDATNLKVGGGVQVAVSLCEDIASLHLSGQHQGRFPWLPRAHVRVSTAIYSQLSEKARSLPTLSVLDSSWRSLRTWIPTPRRYDVSFVVFGPKYGWRQARSTIVGFADGLMVSTDAPKATGPVANLKHLLRLATWRQQIRSSDCIVVESDVVVTRITAWGSRRVMIAPNALNAIFDDPSRWQSLSVPLERDSSNRRLMAYIARGYPHKNHDFLGETGRTLESMGYTPSDLTFLVTLSESEYRARSQAFRDWSINVGPISTGQVPTLYAACDAAIFPSLVETFSVTPLEALAMQRPLFAASRAYVRDIAGDAPFYFDPHNPAACAELLAQYLRQELPIDAHVKTGTGIVSAAPTSMRRTIQYLDEVSRLLPRHAAARDARSNRGGPLVLGEHGDFIEASESRPQVGDRRTKRMI